MARIPGVLGAVGFCTFLGCCPDPRFHRCDLHPTGLGMGEEDFLRAAELDTDVLGSRATCLDKIRVLLSKFLRPSART